MRSGSSSHRHGPVHRRDLRRHPTPRIANRETGQLRVDRDTGRTLYQVGLCLMSGGSADVITVSVPGEPSGVQLGVPVQVRDLVAIPWENGERHGIAYRASEILPLTSVPSSPSASSSASASGARKGAGQ